jgi:hypothetical protein
MKSTKSNFAVVIFALLITLLLANANVLHAAPDTYDDLQRAKPISVLLNHGIRPNHRACDCWPQPVALTLDKYGAGIFSSPVLFFSLVPTNYRPLRRIRGGARQPRPCHTGT